jgi:hypothetical protein
MAVLVRNGTGRPEPDTGEQRAAQLAVAVHRGALGEELLGAEDVGKHGISFHGLSVRV